MKNIIKYISAACLLFFTNACDLERFPIDSLAEGQFYKNTEDINIATVACYNGLYSTIKNEWYLTELRSDNSRHYASSSTATSSRNIYAMDTYVVETTHPVNQEYWEAVYHNIANCNTVLQHLDAATDEGLKLQYEGEALFLRAYHYFNLVRLYGPVFLVTERITKEDANLIGRSSIDKVYEQIETDLKNAIDNRLKEQNTDRYVGRADIWAAKTLLAKVYLTRNRLTEARDLLLDVEANSGYGLISKYEDVFSTTNELNKEIIFTIRFKAGGTGTGSPFANMFAPSNSSNMIITAGGSGYNCPTEDLVKAYDATDQRKNVTMAYTWNNAAGATVHISYVKKYLSQVSSINDADNDWPILRFADVLLMLAEIENELSGPSAALPYLNQVHTRAGLTAYLATDLPDKPTFRLAVEKERRLEFALENQRFFDLVRTDRLIDVMKNHFDTENIRNQNNARLQLCYKYTSYQTYMPNTTLENWQLLLPIPFNVLSVSPNSTQNPGY